MALTVEITGGENIDQGERITLTATVTDASGNTPPGTLQYAWTASRGSFVGATNEASAVYHADFTGAMDVPVTITCNVTRAANATPTSAGPSLTALHDLGITGILVNMFMTALGDPAPNTNSVLYNASTGTLDAGSDQALSSDINIYQLRWDDVHDNFVLNNDGTGHIGNFFTGNSNQSLYIIFADGTYEELALTDFTAGTSRGQTWARWLVSDANIVALLNGLTTTSDLVVGVADAGAIGWGADTGSDTEMFTAAVAGPLSIEAIDEQMIPVLTEDYELEIDIGGGPERAYVDGDMEGFYHTWDPANAKIRIKSELVTRLISAAVWNVHLVKGTETLDAQITYNVVPSAPVITNPGRQALYKGYPISLDIDIANKPTIARGSGLLSGLKYGPREDGEDGLNIAGRLPGDVNLTETAFNAAIYAENNGGSDNLAVPFDIKELVFYGVRISPTVFHQMELNAAGDGVVSVASLTPTLTLGVVRLGADNDYFYLTRNVNVLHRVSRTFTDGGSLDLGSATELFRTSAVIRFRGVDLDDSYIYLVDFRTNRNYKGVFVLNKSDATENRRIPLPLGVDNPLGIVVHGDSLVVLDDTDNALYWFDKNTAASVRAVITKTVNLPTRNYGDISILSDTIFIVDRNNDQIHEIDANSDDGTTITTFDVSYNVPSTLQELIAIAVA